MNPDLYFIFRLWPDLAKSSQGWLPTFLYLSMGGHHCDSQTEFLKKTLKPGC